MYMHGASSPPCEPGVENVCGADGREEGGLSRGGGHGGYRGAWGHGLALGGGGVGGQEAEAEGVGEDGEGGREVLRQARRTREVLPIGGQLLCCPCIGGIGG